MNEKFLGIDLGTSSVKVILTNSTGQIKKAKKEYKTTAPDGWFRAVVAALTEFDLSEVSAVGLSSQVGTYIINDREIIPWSAREGTKESSEIRSAYDTDVFLREIGMPHPATASFPLPRLLYVTRRWGKNVRICQPKELICEFLTGSRISDPFSWRGLTDVRQCKYSDFFLSELGIEANCLPSLRNPTEQAGLVTASAAAETGLPVGIPVFTGLNDFFSALIGMGVREGDAFDITGSSEHLGIIEPVLHPDTLLTSSPFFNEYVHYGVTCGSGNSQRLAFDLFGREKIEVSRHLIQNSPVFLPYLDGERAPIFDPDARGVFFGLCAFTTREEMRYAALEGVAFSLRHIADTLPLPAGGAVYVSGGAAFDPMINTLKATLLDREVRILAEPDCSALGAAVIAAVGIGAFPDTVSATAALCRVSASVLPDKSLQEILNSRYCVYRSLYPALREVFRQSRRNY